VRRSGIWRFLPASADLTHLVITERERSFAIPVMAHPLSANLGNQIMILGYNTVPGDTARLVPGQTISLTLALQASSTMDTAYTVFVHLVDDNETIWAQQDVPAGGEHYQTTLWQPGEVVTTTLTLKLPSDMPATRLRAIMGLYNPASFARLPFIGSLPATDYVPLFDSDVIR
jgi:hypothetical protein